MSNRNLKSRLSDFFSSEYQKLVKFVHNKIDTASAMEAEDFVQEVAMNLFKRANVGAPIENLSAYVYRSLQNQIIESFRRQKEMISLDQPLPNFNGTTLIDVINRETDNRTSESELREISDELYKLFNYLDEEERALVIATELEGYTFKELAEKWQVSINTLLSKKSRAIKKLAAIAAQETS